MVQRHCSTASQRGEWVSHLLAHSGSYGEVTHLSQTIGVSRQTLYSWKAKGQEDLAGTLDYFGKMNSSIADLLF